MADHTWTALTSKDRTIIDKWIYSDGERWDAYCTTYEEAEGRLIAFLANHKLTAGRK